MQGRGGRMGRGQGQAMPMMQPAAGAEGGEFSRHRRSCVLILETIPWRRRTAGRDCTEIYRDRGITSAS
jgi:hypothetical protein